MFLSACTQGIFVAVLWFSLLQGSQPQESPLSILYRFACTRAQQGGTYTFYKHNQGIKVVETVGDVKQKFYCTDEISLILDRCHTLKIKREPTRGDSVCNTWDDMRQADLFGDEVAFLQWAKCDDQGRLVDLVSEIIYQVISPTSMAGLCQEQRLLPWMQARLLRVSKRFSTVQSKIISVAALVGALGIWARSKSLPVAVKKWGVNSVLGGAGLFLVHEACSWFAMQKKHTKRYYPLNSPTPPPSFLLTHPQERQREWEKIRYLYGVYSAVDSPPWHVDVTVTEQLLAHDILNDYFREKPRAHYTLSVLFSALEIIQQYKSPEDFQALCMRVADRWALLQVEQRSGLIRETFEQLKRQ